MKIYNNYDEHSPHLCYNTCSMPKQLFGNENENIPRLIEWILSDEGQTLIEKSGYVRIK